MNKETAQQIIDESNEELPEQKRADLNLSKILRNKKRVIPILNIEEFY